ncbi:MAG TPA: hypothetical protein VJS45_09410 [Acidimicrobiia bacterium]|nr:hypothetical protein [Acidimicrobiia bacterium]
MSQVVERRVGDRRMGGRRSTDRLRAPSGMRTFTLRRAEDVSGVSGTGIVLEGTLFTTGIVVVHWLTPPPRGSIAIFDTLDQLLSIHVRPHPENRAVLIFDDGVELSGDALHMPDGHMSDGHVTDSHVDLPLD